MKITTGCRVRIDYDLTIKGGDVVESSARSGPLTYVHGEGKLLPALERVLDGMSIGEEQRGVLTARDQAAAAPRRDITRGEFPATERIEVGRVFGASDASGKPVSFEIVDATAERVTVRFLHPLADKDLEYRVKVLMIDDPRARRRAAVPPPPPPADALLVAEDE